MQTKEKKTLNKTRCPECDSTQVLYRIRLKDFICRQCGYGWNKTSEPKGA